MRYTARMLRSYALGAVEEPQALLLAQALAGNASLRRRLDLVRDDLVEGYLTGQLDTTSRRRLEGGYLATGDGALRLALLRFLVRLARGRKATRSRPGVRTARR